MLGAIAAGIGALIGGGASAVVSLGSGILGGVGGLASGVGSALFGGQAAVPVAAGAEMGSLAAASAAPGGTGLVGGLVDVLGSGKLASTVGGAGSLWQVLNPPEEKVIVTERTGTLPTPRIAIPTLPAMMYTEGKQAEPQVFTTTTPVPAKPDYLPLIIIAAIVLLLFMRKK